MLTQSLTRKISGWLITLSALALLASPSSHAQPNPPQKVFKVEMLPPEIVFKEGFVSDGNVFSVLDHAMGRTCTDDFPNRRTAWLSTTSDRVQAERFLLRQLEREHASQPSGTPAQAWLYEIRTDQSYLQVEPVINQVITAATNNQHGYIPSNATVLRHVLQITDIRERAEVLTTHIAPKRVISAQRVTYNPSPSATQRLVWGATYTNANFQAPQSPIDNLIADLNTVVPLDSPELIGFSGRAFMSCFQTCDGASASHRIKRSLTTPAHSYCAAAPNKAETFIGSDD